MKKALLVMAWAAVVFFTQALGAAEPDEYGDKQIEELSKKCFHYAIVDGKETLTLHAGPEYDQRNVGSGQPCENTLAKLKTTGAAISVPGTSLILAFLDCPAAGPEPPDSIVAFFHSDELNTPLCISHVDLFADQGLREKYYHGSLRSLAARKAKDKSLYVVATLSGADGGDHWISFAFLHIDVNCRITLLSKLYSGWHCNGVCDGDELEYSFIDNTAIEVITKEMRSLLSG